MTLHNLIMTRAAVTFFYFQVYIEATLQLQNKWNVIQSETTTTFDLFIQL